ncbi:MAG: hypothetical protein PHT81_06470 [Endomicrobiaceae bacterium]|nr:hypothetical protein [Endomicrobiaceae bacterium]MDD3106699.1 hypothetical protein [Bacilli bacterium]
MITEFINRVVIIDNKLAEVDGLKKVLQDHDIVYEFFSPTTVNDINFKKNRQLIFLDLSLDDSKSMTDNIAQIRILFRDRIIGKDFGLYGVVVWSKHQEDVGLLKEKVQEDRNTKAYTSPLFIIGLDKTPYITAMNFDTLFTDIETALNGDVAATFFLEWSNTVNKAQSKTIDSIYSQIPDYKNSNKDAAFIFRTLAKNYTGIQESEITEDYPLHIDAFKSFDDLLHAELIGDQKATNKSLVTQTSFSNTGKLPEIYSYINSAILIDTNNITQNVVIPGNVYEIKETESIFISDKAPDQSTKIVFEITPPCDFSQQGKRIRARLIGGFLIDKQEQYQEQLKKLKCTADCFYKDVYPIKVPTQNNPQALILDFRCLGDEDDSNLQDESKYKILFRAKPKLFADIIQKFSSHAARLGLSVIHG